MTAPGGPGAMDEFARLAARRNAEVEKARDGSTKFDPRMGAPSRGFNL